VLDAADMSRVLACFALLVLACDPGSSTEPKGDTGKRERGEQADGGKQGQPEPAADPNGCRPPNLASATPLRPFVPPQGCRLGNGGTLAAPLVVADAATYASVLQCDTAVAAPLALDFGREQLLVVSFSMSPAYAGLEALDDGSTITFVQRDRSPCPSDPLPMPMNTTVAYVAAKDAARSYAQGSCTLPAQCK
jgi:hypothetical protein